MSSSSMVMVELFLHLHNVVLNYLSAAAGLRLALNVLFLLALWLTNFSNLCK
jgi:hypothetical protein